MSNPVQGGGMHNDADADANDARQYTTDKA